MPDVAVLSKSDAIKEVVLGRISACGGKISGDWDDLREAIGLDISKSLMRKVLWKLVDDGALKFSSTRSWEDCRPRGLAPITSRSYELNA